MQDAVLSTMLSDFIGQFVCDMQVLMVAALVHIHPLQCHPPNTGSGCFLL